jgi:hypothetical protein
MAAADNNDVEGSAHEGVLAQLLGALKAARQSDTGQSSPHCFT